MADHELRREQRIEAPVETVFEFFSVATNLERITPDLLRFEVLTPGPVTMKAGTVIEYRLHLRGIPLRWQSVIEEWQPNVCFVDRQLKGPYALWHHRHEFEPAGDNATIVRDLVTYRLPLSPLSDLALPLVRRDLKAIFDHRQAATERLIAEGSD
ncbi:MAG: SRPBCC family protein [Solirubrobacterales bacterium]|nr:SRPBCC family protein [Solirubrobacterales bacterium]